MKLPVTLSLLVVATSAGAHQPVMDMAPRWADGFGFQVRQEHFGSDELRRENSGEKNPLGLERFVDATWLEGVYTFDRSVRATIKIPYLRQRRTARVGSEPARQRSDGLGDIVFGLPLKRYTNHGASTENWSLTPSLRVPTGTTSGEFPTSDGSWDIGLSASYSRETPLVYQLYDVFFWKEGSGKRGMRSGDSWGLDINVGLHPWHDNDSNSGIFALWDITARHNAAPNALNLTTASGGDRVHTGPVFVYYRAGFMLRAEFKLLAYERVDGVSLSRGNEYSVGIGFAF